MAVKRDRSKDRFPALLNQLADTLGRQAALTVAGALGGSHIYVPSKIDRHHWLAQLLGFDLASALVRELSSGVGCRISIPLGPYAEKANLKSRIDALDSLKLTARQISNALHIAQRTVYRRRAARRQEATRNLPKEAEAK
jgi:hypothetical protein